jgi:putative glycosyltransferase (TIGR04372 family)
MTSESQQVESRSWMALRNLGRTLARHHHDVMMGGKSAIKWKASGLLRRFLSAVLFGLNSIWALPAAVIIHVLRPWRIVRIGDLDNRWFGHFIVDAGDRLARKRIRAQDSLDIYYLMKSSSPNFEWETMVRKEFTIASPLVRHVVPWLQICSSSRLHIIPSARGGRRDVEGLFAQHDGTLEFREGAQERALEQMRRMGWTEGEPFVCLHIRDSQYRELVLHEQGLASDVRALLAFDASHRDSDISSYLSAITWMLDQGFWVIRTGRKVSSSLTINHARLIDYPFFSGKSDLLDIWMFANCTAVITTGSGPDAIATMHRRPALFINLVPIGRFSSYTDSMTVPKTLRWKSSGAQLSISEMLIHSYDRRLDYEREGIDVVDLTSDQIRAAVEDFFVTLHRCGDFPHEESDRTRELWRCIASWPDFNRYHGWIHPRARFSESWLKEQPTNFFR